MFKFLIRNMIYQIIVTIMILGAMYAQHKEEFLLPFDYEIAAFPGRSDQLSKIDIYIWIRNSHVQFIAKDTVFAAKYQLNLGISRQDGSSVLTEDKTFSITERNYSATIDPKNQRVHHFEFHLAPGEYRFEMRLIDLNSKRIRVQSRNKEVRSFAANILGLSDVLLVRSEQFNLNNVDDVIPSLRIPMQEKIYVYAQIVKSAMTQHIKIESTLKHENRSQGFTISKDLVSPNAILPISLQINKESMMRGLNELYLKISDETNSKAVKKDLIFVAGSEDYPGRSIDDMIAPLNYVTDGDDWKRLNNALPEEQEKVFREFWQQRDPTPESPGNELFDEFYKRVDIANKNFGISKQMGWRTDRGHVYIIFGPPDRVETTTPSRYSAGSYEIWYYDELREKFVFLDEYGFGEFRLVSGNLRPAY